MFHEDFSLIYYIANNFIWTTLKMIFSIFRFFLHPQIPDFQILSDHNKPYINGNIIYSALRWCINLDVEKLTLMTGFVLQGHIWTRNQDKNTVDDFIFLSKTLWNKNINSRNMHNCWLLNILKYINTFTWEAKWLKIITIVFRQMHQNKVMLKTREKQ